MLPQRVAEVRYSLDGFVVRKKQGLSQKQFLTNTPRTGSLGRNMKKTTAYVEHFRPAVLDMIKNEVAR